MGLSAIAAVSIGSPELIRRVDAVSVSQPAGAASPTSTSSAISGVSFSSLSNAPASQPSVSGTGERVVFVAAPGAEDGRTSSIWMRDRGTDELTELTLPNPNVRVGDSVDPVISADGCVVVMTTQISYDLFRDDDRGNRWDVYRMTVPACGGSLNDWTLVSTRLDEDGVAEARDDVVVGQPAAVSGSGTVVAYVHPMDLEDDVAPEIVRPNTVEVVDLAVPVDDAKHTTTAPGLPIDLAAPPLQYAGESAPALTADGNEVVFTSDATSELPVAEWGAPVGDSNTAPSQVYSWDRSEADPFLAVRLISQGASGVADAAAGAPVVSGDGRFIAFSSAASNLVDSPELTACAAACAAQIYIVDRDTDNNQVLDDPDTTKVSIVSAVYSEDGNEFTIGNAASFAPTISSDGNTLAFASQANNLLQIQAPGGGDVGDGDVITADLTTRHLQRTFDIPAPTPGAYAHPHLSANSRVLVADTIAADRLLADPTLTGRRVVAAAFVPAVSLADLDLGTVLVKVMGPEWFVNVVNSGPGTFVPATITSSNPDFAITGGTCGDLAAISAGQSCSVKVTLTPSVAGPQSSLLTVAEAGFGAITLTSHLTGSGGNPALLAAPTAMTFSPTVVGQTSTEIASFDISNIYISPIAVTTVTIDGANAGDFAVDAKECLAATAIQTTVIEKPVVTTSTVATTTPTSVTPTSEQVAAGPPTGDDATGSTVDPGAPADPTTSEPTTAPPTTVAPTTTVPMTTAPPSTTPATAPPTSPVITETVTEVVPGVAMNTSCKVMVTFTPTDAGSRTASVNIGSSVNEYTSMLISGTGVYTPSLVAPSSATPGRDIVVGGSGYPADTPIAIGWSDGSGTMLDAQTDALGNFIATFPVALSQRAGATTLVAQVPNGPSASIAIEVERSRRRSGAPRG